MKHTLTTQLIACLWLLGACLPTAMAQGWTDIYTYDVQDLVWDQPKVDVSQQDEVMASMNTIRTGRHLTISADAGDTWSVIDSSFQRGFAGFDNQGGLYLVNSLKVSGASLTYYDSISYSADLGQSFTNLGDHPDNSPRPSAFYIDGDGRFYGLSSTFWRQPGATAIPCPKWEHGRHHYQSVYGRKQFAHGPDQVGR